MSVKFNTCIIYVIFLSKCCELRSATKQLYNSDRSNIIAGSVCLSNIELTAQDKTVFFSIVSRLTIRDIARITVQYLYSKKLMVLRDKACMNIDAL